MDAKRARSLLRDLLLLLSKGFWWPVNIQDHVDHGIGKVFARPILEIEALLVNASFGKRTRNGFTFDDDKFELFAREFILKRKRKRKDHYIATYSRLENPTITNIKCAVIG